MRKIRKQHNKLYRYNLQILGGSCTYNKIIHHYTQYINLKFSQLSFGNRYRVYKLSDFLAFLWDKLGICEFLWGFIRISIFGRVIGCFWVSLRIRWLRGVSALVIILGLGFSRVWWWRIRAGSRGRCSFSSLRLLKPQLISF